MQHEQAQSKALSSVQSFTFRVKNFQQTKDLCGTSSAMLLINLNSKSTLHLPPYTGAYILYNDILVLRTISSTNLLIFSSKRSSSRVLGKNRVGIVVEAGEGNQTKRWIVKTGIEREWDRVGDRVVIQERERICLVCET